MNINIISKILLIFIFIQLVSVVYSVDCIQGAPGISLVQDYQSPPGEYVVKLNTATLNNLELAAINQSDPYCQNKQLVLLIDNSEITFNFSIQDAQRTISGVDVLRIKNSIININARNLDGSQSGFTIDVNTTEVIGSSKIIFTEKDRNTGDNSLFLLLNDLTINQGASFDINVIGKTPSYDWSNNEIKNTKGTKILFASNKITNQGTININLKGGDGNASAIASTFTDNMSDAGNGWPGGDAIINIDSIDNQSGKNFNINVRSGKGGDGRKGFDEVHSWHSNLPGPSDGGDGNNGGTIYSRIGSIKNKGNLKIEHISGNGGIGGNAGTGSYCLTNTGNPCTSSFPELDVDAGNGGNGGDISIVPIDSVENTGSIIFINQGGQGNNGGNAGTSNAQDNGFHSFGLKGKGGNGGSISDLNISNIINTGDFNYTAKSGMRGIAGTTGVIPSNLFSATGSVGSVNINKFSNKSNNTKMLLEVPENQPTALAGIDCGCDDDTPCSTTGDPTIGNININYLTPGSYLPKSLTIKKLVPINETTINITGCTIQSLGSSQANYVADNFILKASNLSDIQHNFDNSSTNIGRFLFERTICPVCESLDLNNTTLRINKEYTIYTADNISNISQLYIYYINPDGTVFTPPGSTDNYPIYTLAPGQQITPATTQTFNGVKEYKISKDKLKYVPTSQVLEDLEQSTNGYTIEDVRLFCPGQRYLLKFRLGNADKEIYFTPLFEVN